MRTSSNLRAAMARHRLRPRAVSFVVAIAVLGAGVQELEAQSERVARILEQDSTLDNLIDPPGYETAEPDTLGDVMTAGEGPGTMILIPGLGFGGDVFQPLLERLASDFTMHAVTLAGFGGTAAPPTPPPEPASASRRGPTARPAPGKR